MKKYAYLLFLLVFSSNCALADVYCPQTMKCNYETGCEVTNPVPYPDAQYFNTNPPDYTEGTYQFNGAYFEINSSIAYCEYTQPNNNNSVIATVNNTVHMEPSLTLSSNNWQRLSNKEYDCKGNANNCPFALKDR